MSSGSKRRPVRFEERAELLDFLLEVSAITAETLDLDRLLSNVAIVITRVIPTQLFAILLYSERRKGLRIRYAHGHRKEVVDNLLIPLGEGVTGKAGETREPLLINDVRSYPGYLTGIDAVRSEMAVPMLARGKLVGVLDFQATRVGAFTAYDLSIVRLIATRIATSVENARLYRRVDLQHRTMRTLVRISQEFSSILDLDELLQKLAEIMRTLIDYDAFSILLLEDSRPVLRNRFSVRFDQQVDLDEIEVGHGLTGTAAALRQPVRSEDTLADPRYIATHPSIRSEVAVPLMLRDRVIGVVDLESQRMANYTVDHVRTLTLLAPQIASAIENAKLYEEIALRERRMEEDLQAARKLQTVLLPNEAPEVEGLETAVGLRPAREISGDLYDFFEYGSDEVAVVFGDSSGKGAAAALYGALVGGLLRSLARRKRSPAELLQLLNNALVERRAEAQYATLLALHWNRATSVLAMANAGGTPPLICRGDQLLNPQTEGVPIGLLDDRQYDELQVTTEPGDLIVLASDGIQDALNTAGEEYGRERMGELIKRNSKLPAAELVQALFDDVHKFTGDAAQFDDQTILILRVK